MVRIPSFYCYGLGSIPGQRSHKLCYVAKRRKRKKKYCRNQYSRNQAPHSESCRTQVYYTGGPREVNTPSSEPRTKGLQSFYTLLLLLLLLNRFSHVRLCATPQTAAHQASPSLGFSRQEYWSGLTFPSPMHACMLSRFSHVRLYVTLWIAAHQAPLSTGFSRQEYWSGFGQT